MPKTGFEYSVPGAGLNLKDLIWRKYHELTNLPLPPEDLSPEDEPLEVLSDAPGSPLSATLGIPMAKRAREILAKHLKGYADVEDTVKAILYRFQREPSPVTEKFRRGGEYYYAAKPGDLVRKDYIWNPEMSETGEGGNILKTIPVGIKNPMIFVDPTTYKGTISALGGSGFFDTLATLANKMRWDGANPDLVKAFSKLTGATPKEIKLAVEAHDIKNSLLDVAKKKLLQRAGIDAIVRARGAVPEVFVTNPNKLQDIGEYFNPSEIPRYLKYPSISHPLE